MDGYTVNIVNVSKDISRIDRVKLKDTLRCISLADATKTGSIVIDVDYYAELEIHNPRSQQQKEYNKYVIVGKNGERYITGSKSLMESLISIMQEFEGSDEEYEVEVYRLPSKNRQGAEFLTCSLV